MPEDIRKTGPVGLKGLNRQQDVRNMSLEDQWKYMQSIPRSIYSSGPEENVGLAAMNAGYGQSQYDDAITSASQFEDINEIRYAEQPWYDTLANGLGKMLGTAGTTLVSSLVGLPVGIGTAIGEQRWSGLWDNSVTQAMGNVDDWLEENMKNYQSQAQQEAKWYQRFGDMNWWADNVIKNAGFALGAAGSMALGSGALGLMSKSLGFVDKVSKGGKVANQFLSSLFAATGEGMIEARQGVEERNKVEFQRLDEALAPEYNALDMAMQQAKQEYNATGDFKTYEAQMNDLLAQRQVLDGRKAAGQQQIEESGRALGNQILLGNQVLLTAGNMIQFGKAMANSYDAARHAAETASKAAKPFGVSAVIFPPFAFRYNQVKEMGSAYTTMCASDQYSVFITCSVLPEVPDRGRCLVLIPKTVVIGVEVQAKADPGYATEAVRNALSSHQIAPEAVCTVAVTAVAREHEAVAAISDDLGCFITAYDSRLLKAVRLPLQATYSPQKVTSDMCTAAACVASDNGRVLFRRSGQSNTAIVTACMKRGNIIITE